MMDGTRRGVLLRPPTIRRLVVLWAGCMLLTWVILVSGWFAARHRLTSIDAQVAEDIQGLDATRRLEAAILAYRHNDLLWHMTHQDQYLRLEEEQLANAEQLAREFAPYVNTAHERALWVSIQDKLRAFREQPALTSSSLMEAEVGATSDLLAVVHDFQQENQDQMEASVQAAIRVHEMITYWAVGLSVTTAFLLSVGAWGLLRRIIRPTLALKDAAQAFGQGDFSAQATILYEDELGALAQTFNNMAKDIADREKDRLQFVAMVVHDLKNPVLAIDMAARMLGQPAATAEDRRSYLDGIREEVGRLRGIIRDLTDDIQVTNGRFSVRKTEVDLGALVLHFVETQSKVFATHQIMATAGAGCTIWGDAARIERVLMNLVSNAVKYSPRGTRVSLRVEKEGAQAVLTVSDQGPGIAKDDLGVLFQPFGRGRSANALAEGTGMGLYVVKQIVEAHEGRIEVHSEVGQGATFEIRLPLAPAPAGLSAIRSARAPDESKKKNVMA
jgi:signal transduction histidine kinase